MIYYYAVTNPFDLKTIYVQRVDEEVNYFTFFEDDNLKDGTVPDFIAWCELRDGVTDFNGVLVKFTPADEQMDFETRVRWT